MTYDEKLALLKRYATMKDKMDFINNRMYNVRGVSYGDRIHGTCDRTVIDDIADRDRAKEYCDVVFNAIQALDNSMERLLLDYVYLQGWTIQKVYDKKILPYSYRHMRRLNYNGICHIGLPTDLAKLLD